LAQKLDIRFSGDGNKVLLFEADSAGLPQDVYSFSIDRYGASYLSGAILGVGTAAVLAAAPGFETLETSIEGFRAGYEAHKKENDSVAVYYVSEKEGDESAFNDVESAYMATYTLIFSNFFGETYDLAIFPLLGGAIKGARRAVIDAPMGSFVIGMDVDQSEVLPKVPFSLTVDIKGIVVRYLQDWRSGHDWPRYRSFGLDDGGAAIVFNKEFDAIVETYEARDKKYYDTAVREEARHAKK
jgi:basic membrane lipoprotein Med (substrate-binding protein (PBP1-ABC) superfamily)